MPLLRAKELAAIIDKAQITHALCDARLADELQIATSQMPIQTKTLGHLLYFNAPAPDGTTVQVEVVAVRRFDDPGARATGRRAAQPRGGLEQLCGFGADDAQIARLVERGVRFVQICSANQAWDNHSRIIQTLPDRCRMVDRPSAALVQDVNARLRVPGDCRDLAVLVAREHGNLRRIWEMRPGTVVEVFERCDAFRKPARFTDLLRASECDHLGRAGFDAVLELGVGANQHAPEVAEPGVRVMGVVVPPARTARSGG